MILLNVIFWAAVIYGLAGVIISFVPKYKFDERNNKIPDGEYKILLPARFVSLAVGVLGLAMMSVIIKVDAQEVGVVITPSGVKSEELNTGWHVIMPWCSVKKMDKTVWVYTFAQSKSEGSKAKEDAIWSPTSEGMKLGYDISITWRINPKEASWIYSNISEQDGGDDARYQWIENNIIRAYTKSALSTITKNYKVTDAYSTKRDEIQKKTEELLRKEIESRRLILEAVNIREVHYNADFEKAINNKKLAEQEALRLIDVTKQKEEQLKQAKIEKDMQIQKAQGEAEALRIKGNSINANPKIIQLEWINRWDGKLPTYMMGDGKGIIINLDN